MTHLPYSEGLSKVIYAMADDCDDPNAWPNLTLDNYEVAREGLQAALLAYEGVTGVTHIADARLRPLPATVELGRTATGKPVGDWPLLRRFAAEVAVVDAECQRREEFEGEWAARELLEWLRYSDVGAWVSLSTVPA